VPLLLSANIESVWGMRLLATSLDERRLQRGLKDRAVHGFGGAGLVCDVRMRGLRRVPHLSVAIMSKLVDELAEGIGLSATGREVTLRSTDATLTVRLPDTTPS